MNRIISIIGAGKVGTAIGCSLKRRGYTIFKIINRSLESARRAIEYIGEGQPSDRLDELYDCREDIIFITTSDSEIEKSCKEFIQNREFKEGCLLIHCSGALSSQVLSSAQKVGLYVGSIHPMQSFANIEQAINNLPESFWGVEGDTEIIERLKELVEDMEGTPLKISSDDKSLYHTGAVIACNYFVTLIELSLKLYEKIGISREEALKAFLPLLKGTVRNIELLGTTQALTGPVARGDVITIQKHIKQLKEKVPYLLEIYNMLGRHTIYVAIAKGTLNNTKAKLLLELFN